MADIVKLGKFIRRIRKQRNLTLQKVGASLGKSAGYVCDIEKGRRGKYINPLLLIKFAEILDVPLTTMLTNAGMEVDENSVKYRALLKMTRNKRRSQRIVEAFAACYSHLEALKAEASGVPALERLAENLTISMRELDTAISLA